MFDVYPNEEFEDFRLFDSGFGHPFILERILDNPNPFHIGQCYQKTMAQQLRCKKCSGINFHIAVGSYFTAIRCTGCLWEACVHEG